MSDRGTMSQMATNIGGLIQYVELLVSGKSQASATGGPLGTSFSVQTAQNVRQLINAQTPTIRPPVSKPIDIFM